MSFFIWEIVDCPCTIHKGIDAQNGLDFEFQALDEIDGRLAGQLTSDGMPPPYFYTRNVKEDMLS